MIHVRIASLARRPPVEPAGHHPQAARRGARHGQLLPIWIGHPEATAILLALEGVEPPRPLTHDLLKSVLETLDSYVERVEITRVEEGTFFAAHHPARRGAHASSIDARPSDSIALAIRMGAPIFVAEEVLEAAAVPDDTGARVPTRRPSSRRSATSSTPSTRRTSRAERRRDRRADAARYSYRSASIGSSRDARYAGYTPKNMPTAAEKKNASATAHERDLRWAPTCCSASAPPAPTRMPITPAEHREHHRLDDELAQDVVRARADRLADADLAGPLGHADQHDVHDADAADEQRDARDAGEHRRERARAASTGSRASAPG